MRKIDLTGKVFGKLTVMYELPERKNSKIIWHCKCECGNECDVTGHELKSGDTRSCGCLHTAWCKQQAVKMAKKRIHDVTNQRFGKLVALKPTEKRKNNNVVWLCQCDCGNTVEVGLNNLTQGFTKSCGCLKSMGEEKITNLLDAANISYQREYTEESLNKKRFDFAIFDSNNHIIRLIEFDGKQHFKYSNNGWCNKENFDKIQYSDRFKNKWALEHQIPLVRIPYTEQDNMTIYMLM